MNVKHSAFAPISERIKTEVHVLMIANILIPVGNLGGLANLSAPFVTAPDGLSISLVYLFIV